MTKPDTPFPRHWLYYIVLKYAVIAAAGLLAFYVALAEGVVRRDEGSLTQHLVEDRALRVRIAERGGGREASTRYRVLQRRRSAAFRGGTERPGEPRSRA